MTPRVVADPTAPTPVEVVTGGPCSPLWAKRDDLFASSGQRGGKVRSCLSILSADPPPAGVITASARQSPQAIIVAALAADLGLPCRIHVPSGAYTEEMRAAEAFGAEIVQHRPGRNSVLIARANSDVAANPTWRLVPFGMECPEAVSATRRQALSLLPLPDGVERIVIPVGSGMSLAGLLAADLGVPILGVSVGADPSKRLDRYAPGWDTRPDLSLVSSPSPYTEAASSVHLGHIALDAHYEAKCLPSLSPGDLLWIVGHR